MHADRLARLRRAVAAAGMDAVAVVPGPNLAYLTGLAFHLSERPVVAFFPTAGEPVMVVPALEATKARQSPIAAAIETYDDPTGPAAAFRAALDGLGLAGRRLGVEGRRIRFLELDLMARSGAGPEVVAAEVVFADLRMIKGGPELAAMRRAVVIAEDAFRVVLPALVAGCTEREFAGQLTMALLRAGSAAELPFSPIVASGPNGALPHAFPTDRRLVPGDVVTIDWGATFEGYVSDITRNVVIGGAPPNPDLVRAHAAVQAANDAGRAAVRPGVTGQDVDRATRAVIERAGLGAFFVHRTGHGLGREGHEEPNMTEGEQIPLAPGMTFTIEPGVYLPGIGGVRIEDDVVVTGTGSDTLTSLPRDLVAAGG